MPLLFDTIIRFRLHSIAIIADIEKAFLQVQMNESDRDMVRFLWFDDIGKENLGWYLDLRAVHLS